MATSQATATAPVNIAVIKYWGKRDERLLLPINSSLSATLDQAQLHARTTVATNPGIATDRIWLNGTEEDINNPRLQNCLEQVRALATLKHGSDYAALQQGIHICSVNNFPTAAGLASSAAGYACLVQALAKLLEVEKEELSAIARMGSGSACRSMFGGFVRWTKGEKADGTDSIASQVAPTEHWSDMHILVLVVNAGKKSVSSTSGMQTSVHTSALIKHRADVVVPQRMAEIEEAIQNRDFETFGRLTMQDSNQFHAICLDTYPPITYMNDVSHRIVQVLTRFNAHAGEIKAAYTFDAGPNAVVYARAADVPTILALVNDCFPSTEPSQDGFFRGLTEQAPAADTVSSDLKAAVAAEPLPNSIKYVLHTKVGPGPQILEDEASSLVDDKGMPRA